MILPDSFGGRGGIAKFNRDFITALCHHPEVQVVIALPRKRLIDPIGKLPDKLTYVTVGTTGKLKFVFATIRTLFRRRFDWVICGHLNLLPLASVLHHLSGARLLLMLYGIEAWQPSSSVLLNYLVRDVDTIVSISKTTLNRFIRWTNLHQSRCYVLPNAIQLEHFGAKAKSPGLLEKYNLHGKTVLLTLGRLDSVEQYKGFDEVMEVLPDLLSEYPNLVYLIAGDGDDRPRLTAKSKSLKLDKHVIFTGFVPEDRKGDYYRLADAFVMPGYGEGFGFVLLEAMACGIPVMASQLDGSREAVLDGKLGIVVDPRNREAVKQGIMETLKLPRVVPEGLVHFSYPNFGRRCHAMVDQLLVQS
jgi:glycosyltransferase involved in cell wall biosynthesis